MKTSPNGLAIIKHYEQCRLRAFKPVESDPWTIGWGRTKDVLPGQECSPAEADQWLKEDIAEAESAVNAGISAPLTQNQFDALVSWQYNTGGLYISTLRKEINTFDYKAAADQFPRWNKAGGIVLAGLVKRREDERRLFLTPDGVKFQVT